MGIGEITLQLEFRKGQYFFPFFKEKIVAVVTIALLL